MPLLVEIFGTLTAAVFGFVFRRAVLLGLARGAIWVSGYLLLFGTRLGPEIGIRTVTLMAAALEQTRPTMLAAAGTLLKELTGQTIDVATAFDPKSASGLAGGPPGTFTDVAEAIRNTIAGEGDLTPEAGLANLNRLFSLHLGTSLQAWGIDLAAESLSLGRLRTLAQFHAAIDAGLGFRRLGMLMWRGPVEEAITKPIRRWFAEKYMAALPTATEAITGWYSGVYDDEARDALLRSAGYNHTRALELTNVAQRHLTPAEGIQALRRGLIDEAALDELLKADKLGPERAGFVKTLLLGQEQEKELQALVTTARELYRAGDLDEGTYRQYLTQAHYTDEEQTLALTADQLAVRKDVLLSKSEVLAAYRRGLTTAEVARAQLRRRHYADADIDTLFALEVRQLDSAQVLDSFTRGAATREVTLRALQRLGYSPGDAAALLQAHARTLTEGQVVDALRRNLVTPEVAREDLARLGVDPQTADMLVALGQKTLSTADIQAALVKDLLTPQQAHDRLVALGYSPQDAELYVALRIRQLTAGQTLDAYGDGVLGRDQAIGDLRKLGLSAVDAQTVVTAFDKDAQAAAAKAAQKAAEAAAKALAKAQAPPAAGGTGGTA